MSGFPEFNSTNNPNRISSSSTNSNPSDYESYGALDETSSQITFIAVITSVSSRFSNTEYIMEDGTGLISVKIWQDSTDEANAKNDDIKENTYVTVFGNLKVLNKERYVVAVKIKPVTDFNEISSHIGHVIFDHLYFIKNVNLKNPLYKDIIAFVTNDKNGVGTNISQMANALSNKHGSDMIVVNAVEQMCSDGLLYSTVDEYHVGLTS
nr:13509_t:CDS:2 [Entrophospora candida]